MEEEITKYYLIQDSEKVLKHLDVFEIVSLLDSGKLDGQSYVFDLRVREWCLVKDIRVLKDTCYDFKDSSPRECPTFTPPHKLPGGEFSSEIDSDYEYLLNYTHSLSTTINESREDTLEVMLEEAECRLLEKENELLGLKSINLEFEELIHNLKNENAEVNSNILSLENEKIDCLKTIEKNKQKSNRDMDNLRSEYESELGQYRNIEKVNFKLSERNKSLLYALKLERAQSEQYKSLLEKEDRSTPVTSHSEELLTKAMEYLFHGPIGGEKDLLEKKVTLLTNELNDIEEFYNKKIDKIKNEYESELSSLKTNQTNEIHKIESLTYEREEFENKFKNLLTTNKNLLKKIEGLELELSVRKNEQDIDKKSLKEDYLNLITKYKALEKNYLLEVKKNKDNIAQKDKESNVSVKYIKEELNKSRNEVESIQAELAKITSERDSLYDERDGLYESDTKVNHLVENLRSDNKKLISKYSSLKDKTTKYKKAYNELSEKYKSLKDDFKDRNDQFNKLKTQSEDIIESLKEKVDGANDVYSEKLKELEAVKDREKTLLLKIDEFKNTEVQEDTNDQDDILDSSDDEELNRLIGDAFEVSNDRIWMVSKDGQEPSGPYDFTEIYKMKINGELDKNVKVKKGTEFYKPKSEIFELSVPVSTHGSGENIRYFIKRSSMRVPFYELVTFEINGEEHRGYCTSLSLGGIFIELNQLSSDLVVDKKGRILFSAGALDNPFQCVAQVKNISESRPRGIGLMFVDLPELAKDDITFYINNYLNKTKQVA